LLISWDIGQKFNRNRPLAFHAIGVGGHLFLDQFITYRK